MMERFLEYTVGQYMTRQVKTVTRKTTLRELEVWFEKHDCNAFPVVEGKELVGLVTKFDFLKAFAFPTREMLPQYDELMNRTVGEVMTTAVAHREPAAPLTNALQLMIHHRARSFPVVAPCESLASAGVIWANTIARIAHRQDRGSCCFLCWQKRRQEITRHWEHHTCQSENPEDAEGRRGAAHTARQPSTAYGQNRQAPEP